MNTACGFSEKHQRGEHVAIWSFPVPKGGSLYAATDAVGESALLRQLREAALSTRLCVVAEASAVKIFAPTKAEFGSAMLLLKGAVGDMTPEAFTTEIEAALGERDRSLTARKRAEEILSCVGTVREKLVGHARQRAAVALAAEIATLRAQYEALAAEYAAEAARFVEQVLNDAEAFSEVPDAEIVRAEARASIARHPLRFGGPSIGGGGSLLEGYRFAELPDYGEALESLTQRLA